MRPRVRDLFDRKTRRQWIGNQARMARGADQATRGGFIDGEHDHAVLLPAGPSLRDGVLQLRARAADRTASLVSGDMAA